MSISDKAALENELKVLLNSLFGDKCNPYVRFAFKFSAVLSDGKNLATSNKKNLIFEKIEMKDLFIMEIIKVLVLEK